jgi:hypothetical protein
MQQGSKFMRSFDKRIQAMEEKLTPSIVQLGVIYAPPGCSDEHKERQRQFYYDRHGKDARITFLVVNYDGWESDLYENAK